jgi:hypothetical protein
MIWCYIVIAMFIGIIAGFGYYEVTRSELKLNYEMQELVMMLRNTKRNAILIGVIVGAIWPLTLVVLAAVLILVSTAPSKFNDSFDNARETNDGDITIHNIVLDKPAESKNVVVDDTATWIDLNEMDETESDNIEDTEPNTKE